MLIENTVSPYFCERSYNSFYHEKNDTLHTALHLAVIEGHHDMARWVAKKHPQLLRMTDKDMNTPLMLANEKGDANMRDALAAKMSSPACSGLFSSSSDKRDSASMKKAPATETIFNQGGVNP